MKVLQKEIDVITQILEQKKQIAKGQQVKHRIASVIETAKKQGIKILDALSPNFSFA